MEKTILIGNLGFDADIRTLNEKEYFYLTIAHQRGKDTPTIWYHAFYRKTPNNGVLVQYLKKGAKVYLEGSLSASAYISKQDNQPKVDLSVWVNQLDILVFPKREEAQEAPQQERPKANQYPNPADNTVVDDMPF